MPFHRRFGALATVVVLVAACGSSGGASPAASNAGLAATALASVSATDPAGPSPAPAEAPTAAPSPTASPSSATFALTAQVWFSGYLITLTSGTYDRLKQTLNIDATFQNTSTQQTELRQLGSSVKVVWNDQFLVGYVTAGTVPVGATAKGQIQVQTPPDFVVAEAALRFGEPDQHQAIVPLGGAAASSEQPWTLAIVGTVKMGKYVTFKITGAMVVPAGCSGYPDRIAFGPQKANLVSIVLWGTAKSTDPLNYAHTDDGYVLLSDKTKVVSNPPMGLSIPNGATIPNQAMCFAVAAPGSGTYTLKMHEYRSNATGSLLFVVP